MKPSKPIKKLLNMLTYKRKEGSVGQKMFCERFIQPMMGKPDKFNNYICEVLANGELINNPIYSISKIAFMAHHDTVHRTDGRQSVMVDSQYKFAFVDHKECLGADCTTGVWLILEMIRNKVPGLYIIHTGEECGGIGSGDLVKSDPKWLSQIDFAISFDRMGVDSIITHQMGIRTCSESFSSDLESILNLNLKSDSGGTYTDSYEYSEIVSECTNISVGYTRQHTANETQDLVFAEKLRVALINADWSKLKPYRDPTVRDYGDCAFGYNYPSVSKGSIYKSQFDAPRNDEVEELLSSFPTMEKLVQEFPYEVVEMLSEYGYDRQSLAKEIIRKNDWIERF